MCYKKSGKEEKTETLSLRSVHNVYLTVNIRRPVFNLESSTIQTPKNVKSIVERCMVILTNYVYYILPLATVLLQSVTYSANSNKAAQSS